ncbi:hypothetical protein ACJX0J_034144 [Zea mays]
MDLEIRGATILWHNKVYIAQRKHKIWRTGNELLITKLTFMEPELFVIGGIHINLEILTKSMNFAFLGASAHHDNNVIIWRYGERASRVVFSKITIVRIERGI